MHKLWATKGCPEFVMELNIQNISAVESHVSCRSLQAVVLVAKEEGSTIDYGGTGSTFFLRVPLWQWYSGLF